jgi:hypothetical protein
MFNLTKFSPIPYRVRHLKSQGRMSVLQQNQYVGTGNHLGGKKYSIIKFQVTQCDHTVAIFVQFS